MKKPLWLATILLPLVILMLMPCSAYGFENTKTSHNSYMEQSSTIWEYNNKFQISINDIWSTYPYLWIIIIIVAGIIIMLAIFLVAVPSKKKKEAQLNKPDQKGKKLTTFESDKRAIPQVKQAPISPRPAPTQSIRPQTAFEQPVASRGVPVQPVEQYPPQPQQFYAQEAPPKQVPRQPISPQPIQQQVRPQPAPSSRPQPMPPHPISGAQQPRVARPTQPVSQPKFAQPQYTAPSPSKLGFIVSNLSVIPKQVKEGDPITISATVTNHGTSPGQYSMVFRINHIVENIAEMSLAPGASQTATITVNKETAGEYYVEADGLHSTFNVIPRLPASFKVSNFTVKPERVKQGQPVSVGFMVTNTGEKPGVYNAVVLIKGLSEATEEIHLEPGETKSVVFNIVKDTAGFFPVSVEEFNGRFVVEMDWKE